MLGKKTSNRYTVLWLGAFLHIAHSANGARFGNIWTVGAVDHLAVCLSSAAETRVLLPCAETKDNSVLMAHFSSRALISQEQAFINHASCRKAWVRLWDLSLCSQIGRETCWPKIATPIPPYQRLLQGSRYHYHLSYCIRASHRIDRKLWLEVWVPNDFE